MARGKAGGEVRVEALDSFAGRGGVFVRGERKSVDAKTAATLEAAGKVRVIRSPTAGREVARPDREAPA